MNSHKAHTRDSWAFSKEIATTSGSRLDAIANPVEAIGREIIRYGLAAVILWIGAMKFTAYEAAGIEPLVAHSPLMAWIYDLGSAQLTI